MNPRRLPRQLRRLQSRRDRIVQPNSMPLVRQIEVLLHDAYEDTNLTTTHLMSIIVVCIMYLRSQATADYLRDRLFNAVDFAEHVLESNGLMNPRTLKHWRLDVTDRDPSEQDQDQQEGPSIQKLVEMDIPDDISELDEDNGA